MSEREWYWVPFGQEDRRGPLTEQELLSLISSGGVPRNALVWTQGMDDWQQADAVEPFKGVFPPEAPAPGAPEAPAADQRRPPVTAGPIQEVQRRLPQPPAGYTAKGFGSLFGWWLGLAIAGIVLAIFIIGVPMLIAAAVLWYVFLYRAWRQIQDGYPRTSPGMAVGFCFIPFFNLYWQFVAIWGLAQDMNAYARRHGISGVNANEGLALTACILACCMLLPYLNFLIGIALLVVFIIVMSNLTNAARRIAEANAAAAGA